VEKIEGQIYLIGKGGFLLSSFFLPSKMIDNSNSPAPFKQFYSYNIPVPTADDRSRYVQLAQITSWNGDAIDIDWCEVQEEILIKIGDEYIVQPDNVSIIDSLARIFHMEDNYYQIRFSDLNFFEIGINTPSDPEDLWDLYSETWANYGKDKLSLQFSVNIDWDAERLPEYNEVVEAAIGGISSIMQYMGIQD
jgi:hypothetical protein